MRFLDFYNIELKINPVPETMYAVVYMPTGIDGPTQVFAPYPSFQSAVKAAQSVDYTDPSEEQKSIVKIACITVVKHGS